MYYLLFISSLFLFLSFKVIFYLIKHFVLLIYEKCFLNKVLDLIWINTENCLTRQ